MVFRRRLGLKWVNLTGKILKFGQEQITLNNILK